MKLTILGGGGFRVPLVHEAVATAATGLTVDEIALHDVDPERLATISAVIEEQGARLAAEGRAVALPRLVATTDLRVEYAFAPAWALQARVSNVFDRDYETVRWYNQPGRGFMVTLRYAPVR